MQDFRKIISCTDNFCTAFFKKNLSRMQDLCMIALTWSVARFFKFFQLDLINPYIFYLLQRFYGFICINLHFTVNFSFYMEKMCSKCDMVYFIYKIFLFLVPDLINPCIFYFFVHFYGFIMFCLHLTVIFPFNIAEVL